MAINMIYQIKFRRKRRNIIVFKVISLYLTVQETFVKNAIPDDDLTSGNDPSFFGSSSPTVTELITFIDYVCMHKLY